MDELLMRRAARLATVFLLLGGIATSQQPADTPSEPGSLEGTVINVQNGRVVPRATVVLRNIKRLSEVRSVRADGQGHFLVKNVAPGSYRLTAEHQSYFSSTRHQLFQYRVDIASSEQRSNIVLSLQPAAVITGQIADENAEPLQNVQVQLLDRTYRNGRIVLEPAGAAVTDDRGAYRMYDVHPGNYFVVAEVQRGGAAAVPATPLVGPPAPSEASPESDIAYSPAFYPDTTDFMQAQTLAVGAGEEAHANFAFVAKPSVSIRGRVINGVTGDPAPNAAVTALWTEYLDISGTIVNAGPRDGAFAIRGLAPGTYILRAAFTLSGTAYTVQRRVEVGAAGLENVELDALPDSVIAGRVHAEPSEQPQRLPLKIEVDFQSNTSPAHAAAEAGLPAFTAVSSLERLFQARLHPGDQYTVSVRGLPENYYLKSVLVNGHPVERNEVTTVDQSAEIELDISPAGGYIEGVVLNESGQGLPASAVVLVPQDSKRGLADLFRKASTDKEGKFRIRGVPPGIYQLLAFDDVDLNELISQPDIINRFSDRAVPLTVEEQMDYTAALKIIRGSEEIGATAP
jgi:hypothetical protein